MILTLQCLQHISSIGLYDISMPFSALASEALIKMFKSSRCFEAEIYYLPHSQVYRMCRIESCTLRLESQSLGQELTFDMR